MPGSVLHINSEVALSIGSRKVAAVLIGFIQCRLQTVSCDCNITTSAYTVVIGAPKQMLRIEALLLFYNLSPPTCNVSWLPVAGYLPS